MSKGKGKQHEKDIVKSLTAWRPHSYIQRNGDNFTTRRVGDKTIVLPLKSPPDILCASHDMQLLIECKSTIQNRFDFALLKHHQLQALVDFDAVSHHHHGFVALLYTNRTREIGKACWLIPALLLIQIMGSIGKKSVNPSDLGARLPEWQMDWIPAKGWTMPLGLVDHYG